MDSTVSNYEDEELGTRWGVRIGPNMKGIFVQGDTLGWKVDKNGDPHHGDVDPDGRRDLQFSNLRDYLAILGSGPPLESVYDILNYFEGYTNATEVEVRVACRYGEFNFDGTVGMLKTFFKHNPPPIAEEYDDGVKDIDFAPDYDAWASSALDRKTIRSILGRGGREDVWQERDEDQSKSFSVYNPKRKKKARR